MCSTASKLGSSASFRARIAASPPRRDLHGAAVEDGDAREREREEHELGTDPQDRRNRGGFGSGLGEQQR